MHKSTSITTACTAWIPRHNSAKCCYP